MPKQRKELGNYKLKIRKYFSKENQPYTKQGLNLALGIDRKNIFHWRHRSPKWAKNFIIEYDKACQKIEVELLKEALATPQLKFDYWRLAFPQEVEENNEKSNIIINISEPRKIENND
ncbi:hypothetical protein [Spiroplasma endosymbiont of Colias croceus]|uniref:hypothetical protein n=1 Tax=Spiroplasma endosymbiont of Colias croceus TaxID=3066310 RepID=UPI0030D05631